MSWNHITKLAWCRSHEDTPDVLCGAWHQEVIAVRGSSKQEGFHKHFSSLLSSGNTDPELAGALMCHFVGDWNNDPARDNLEQYDYRTHDLRSVSSRQPYRVMHMLHGVLMFCMRMLLPCLFAKHIRCLVLHRLQCNESSLNCYIESWCLLSCQATMRLLLMTCWTAA